MKHRIDAMLNFFAAECSNSEQGAKNLLAESNLLNAAIMDGCVSADELANDIYQVYQEFGADHALGMFQVTVLESFNTQQ